jgi:hypothetical protein
MPELTWDDRANDLPTRCHLIVQNLRLEAGQRKTAPAPFGAMVPSGLQPIDYGFLRDAAAAC